MIKNRIAILFILLANLILLAHIVMPHHHHEGEVCMLNSQCQTDDNDDSSHNGDHKHQGNNDNECRLLKQDILIPSNLIRLDNLSNINDDKSSLYDFHYILENSKLKSYAPEYERNIIPLISSSYAQIANISLGLRAPPIV